MLVCIALAVSAAGEAAQAEPSAFVPAAFRTDQFSLVNAIPFPSGTDDVRVSLPCTTFINKQGSMAGTYCLAGDKESRRYEKNVIDASEHAKMVPARVAGHRKEVTFKFTVIFLRKDGEESIYTVPNQFLNAGLLGANYVAPQLIYNRRLRFPRSCRSVNLILRISVDVRGVPSYPRFHQGDALGRKCLPRVGKRIPKLRYIPGMVNGKPTAMDHLYLGTWRGSWASLESLD